MKILVTGIGGTAAKNFVACLRRWGDFKIVGVDINPYQLAAADAEEKHLVPMTTEASAWLRCIDEISRDCDLIHPQPDVDVAALADHSYSYEDKLFLPHPATVRLCQDKLTTAEILRTKGVPVPRTKLAWAGTNNLVTMLWEEKPIWLRVRFGAGSRCAMKVERYSLAQAWKEHCEKEKAAREMDWITCEYLPGREFANQSLWYEGDLVSCQSRERIEYLFGHVSPTGTTSTPAVARTVREDRITDVALAAVRAMCQLPHGVFGVDMKEDADGNVKVTEVNCGRFYTTSMFLAVAGHNMPAIYCEGFGKKHFSEMEVIDPLPPDLYWVRTVDGRPRLLKEEEIKRS